MVFFSFNEIKKKKETLIGLVLGQILSLLSTSIGFTTSELVRKGINAPTSQSFLGYVLLAIVYGSIMLYRRSVIKAKWYYYFLLALVDVEGNFLVVKAFQNTSMTSVMLLDCWAIPCVLVLTWVFLKTRYSLMKISGVVVCILGVVMVVFSDVHAGDRSGGKNPVKGDFLVIAAATLYSFSNTSERLFLDLIHRSIFERDELNAIHWSTEAVDWLYYLAFATTAIGLIIYSMKENDQEKQSGGEQQIKLLDEEDGDSLRARLTGAST
ncbi:hypothetical protein YC2023_091290 [Brassica napus]